MKFLKQILLGFFLIFSISSFGQEAKKAGASSVSFQYNFEKFSLQLINDPRYSIDSLLGLGGMSDSEYLEERRNSTSEAWGKTFGVKFSNNLSDSWTVSSGLRYTKAVQKINTTVFNDSIFMFLFSDHLGETAFETEYKFVEVPLIFNYNFGGGEAHDRSVIKKGSFFSIGLGFSFNITTHKPYYFHFLEHSIIKKNVGLNGHLNFNYNRGLGGGWFTEIGLNMRTGLINNFVYAPVKSRYTNYGLSFKVGKSFAGKPIKFKTRSILECLSFQNDKDFILGVSAGANSVFLLGPDTKADFLPNLNDPGVHEGNVVSVQKRINPYYGTYFGLFAEYGLSQSFSFSINPVYSQRGMRWEYDYVLVNNLNENYNYYSELKINISYFDIPVLFNYRVGKHMFSVGVLGSLYFTDKMYEYKIGDNLSNNSPTNYFAYSEKNRVLTYFGYKPKDLSYGYILSYNYEIDKWATLTLQAQHMGEIFHSKQLDAYRFHPLTIKTGATFYLFRKSK